MSEKCSHNTLVAVTWDDHTGVTVLDKGNVESGMMFKKYVCKNCGADITIVTATIEIGG